MKVIHNLIDQSNPELVLYVLTDGEYDVNEFSEVNASIIYCHIDSEGYNVTQEELFNERNVSNLMFEFVKIINQYEATFPGAKKVIIGSGNNAEVALDLLLKENGLIEGGILIKPILNIALTEGIRAEGQTKVLIIEGDREDWEKHMDEQEVADILSVNGYEVSVVEVDENADLSKDDLEVAINWVNDNF